MSVGAAAYGREHSSASRGDLRWWNKSAYGYPSGHGRRCQPDWGVESGELVQKRALFHGVASACVAKLLKLRALQESQHVSKRALRADTGVRAKQIPDRCRAGIEWDGLVSIDEWGNLE